MWWASFRDDAPTGSHRQVEVSGPASHASITPGRPMMFNNSKRVLDSSGSPLNLSLPVPPPGKSSAGGLR
jgi:hypothetical protein